MARIIIAGLLLLITSTATADIYFLAKYQPFGGVSYHWNGGQDWSYQRNDLQFGVGWVDYIVDERIKLSLRDYLVLDPSVGLIGIAGSAVISLGNILKFKDEYNYRWYDGSDGDYGYTIGSGYIHKGCFEIEMPLKF